MERDRLTEFLRLVYDESRTEEVVAKLREEKGPEGETWRGSDDVKSSTCEVIVACGGPEHFAVLFDRWVKAQVQPFLSCKPLDAPLSATAESKKESTDVQQKKTLENVKGTRSTGQKKIKKKITPQTISALIPSTLTGGNISCQRAKNDNFRDHFPRLSETKSKPSIAVSSDSSQWPALGNGLKVTKEVNEIEGSYKFRTSRVKDRGNSEKRSTGVVLHCDGIGTSNLDHTTTSNINPSHSTELNKVDSGNSPLESVSALKMVNDTPDEGCDEMPQPKLCHQISQTVQSQLDNLGVTVTVTDAAKTQHPLVSSHVVSEKVSLEDFEVSGGEQVHPSKLNALQMLCDNESESTLAAKRMGVIFGHCILRYYSIRIPLVPSIVFLSKILSVKHNHAGKEIKLSLKNLEKFPTCLLNNSRLEHFAVNAVQCILPMLKSIGGDVLGAFSDALAHHSPSDLSFEEEALSDCRMQVVLTLQQQSEEEKLLRLGNVEAFIRPFDDTSDNRHEYKTNAEKNIYNERERCYDDFSNLFRQFQEVSRSDLDGSKTYEFWNNLYFRGTKILNMQDCNYSWFANIFKQLLLFHGPNLPKAASSYSNKSSQHLKKSSKTSPNSSSAALLKQQSLEDRLSQGGGGKAYSNRHFKTTPSATNTHRNSVSGQNSANFPTSQRMKNIYESDPDPSTLFPGNQLFFFKFLMVMDSHRFNTILEELLIIDAINMLDISLEDFRSFLLPMRFQTDNKSNDAYEMHLVNEESESSPQNHNKSSMSFTLRVLKLRVLGKFLGLLHFTPRWNSSVASLSDSPLLASIQAYSTERQCVSNSLPLSEILRYSWARSSLCLAIPWVVNYLRLQAWDGTSILRKNKASLFQLLRTIELSDTTMSRSIDHQTLMCVKDFVNILISSSFHLNKTWTTKNRVTVVLEIEAFFVEFPTLLAVQRKIHEKKADKTYPATIRDGNHAVTVNGSEDGDLPHNITFDESNVGLSKSFLKYIIPDLFHAMTVMRQKLLQYQRREELLCEKLVAKSNVVNKSPMLRSSRRQAPTLISPNIQSNLGGDTDTTDSLNNFGVNVVSSPRQVASQFMTPSNNFDIMKTPPPTTPKRSGSANSNMHIFLSPPLKNDDKCAMLIWNESTYEQVPVVPSASNESDDVGMLDIQMKLEMSFWNQHPHLYSICNFAVEHVNQACRQRMKERIAELVLQAWSRCDSASGHCMDNHRSVVKVSKFDTFEDRTDFIMSQYQAAIEKQTIAIFDNSCSDTEEFLDEYVEHHLLGILSPFLEAYPLSSGVKDTLMKIAARQRDALKKSLFTFYSVYARKKLSEVCLKSVNQQRKIVMDLVNKDEKYENSQTSHDDKVVVPAHYLEAQVALDICGDRDHLLKIVQDSLCQAFASSNFEQSVYSMCLKRYSDSSGEFADVDMFATDREQLYRLLFDAVICLHIECSTKESDKFLLLCNFHEASFRCFSTHLCGAFAKVTAACGKVVVRALAEEHSSKGIESHANITVVGEDETLWETSSITKMIRNNIAALSSIISWAAEKASVLSTTCQCMGRMKIDVMKLLSTTMGTLLVYDVFLKKHPIFEENRGIVPASDLIIDALHSEVISLDNVAQLLGYSLKNSLITTVFSLLQIRCSYKSVVLSFLGRLLRGITEADAIKLDIDVEIGSWVNDPSVKRIIKTDISVELSNVLDATMKKF